MIMFSIQALNSTRMRGDGFINSRNMQHAVDIKMYLSKQVWRTVYHFICTSVHCISQIQNYKYRNWYRNYCMRWTTYESWFDPSQKQYCIC